MKSVREQLGDDAENIYYLYDGQHDNIFTMVESMGVDEVMDLVILSLLNDTDSPVPTMFL